MNENRTCPAVLIDPTYKIFSIVVNGVLTTVLALLGAIGNVSCLLMLHTGQSNKLGQLKLGSSLTALGIWDTILLISSLFYYGIKNCALAVSDNITFARMTYMLHPITSIANTASVWFVVLIATQRFRATRDPFRRGRHYFGSHATLFEDVRQLPSFLENRRHLILPVVISVGCCLVNVTTFLEIVVIYCYDVVEEEFKAKLQPTPLRIDRYYKLYYRMMARSVFNSLGPLVLVFILTGITLHQLHSARQSRQLLLRRTMSVKHREQVKQRSQTLMSIALIAKFLLLRSLPSTLDIWEAVAGYTTRAERQRFIYVVDISNLLVIINSATNWIVYHKGKQVLEKQISIRSKQRNSRFRDLKNNLNYMNSSWKTILHQNHNVAGERLLNCLLRKAPFLIHHLKSDQESELAELILTNSEEEEEGNEKVTISHHGVVIQEFFDEIFGDLSDGTDDREIRSAIQRVGRIHAAHGIMLNNDVWRELKRSTMEMVKEVQYCNEVERQETFQAWTRFLSVIITEMKLGMWKQNRREFSITVSVDPNTTTTYNCNDTYL